MLLTLRVQSRFHGETMNILILWLIVSVRLWGSTLIDRIMCCLVIWGVLLFSLINWIRLKGKRRLILSINFFPIRYSILLSFLQLSYRELMLSSWLLLYTPYVSWLLDMKGYQNQQNLYLSNYIFWNMNSVLVRLFTSTFHTH